MEKRHKILVIGNMGYVGSVLVPYLRQRYPNAYLVGLDLGIFSHCLTTNSPLPESKLDLQIFGDARTVDLEVLQHVTSVVYLAAISNDPMGQINPELTNRVNNEACLDWANAAKSCGVKSFVFASSCSVYGKASDSPRVESDELNPLTAYAKSKINAELGLAKLSDDSFCITSLRFATACGFSPRLRLDLVLNDFVANSVASGTINVLSDGTPWRPLIHVHDMSRAIDWALSRASSSGGDFLSVNTGSDTWNYRVSELAQAVNSTLGNIIVNINPTPTKDDRSYKVNFEKYFLLAPDFQPTYTLTDTIIDLENHICALGIDTAGPQRKELFRLHCLKLHLAQ